MTRSHPGRRLQAARALATAVAALVIAALSAMPSLGAMRPDSLLGDSPRPVLSVSDDGRPLLNASRLEPGAATQRTVSVVNRGAADGVLWLSVDAAGTPNGKDLGDVLRATVADDAGTVLASGTVADFGSRPLGRLGAGRSRGLTVTVTLPADAGGEYAGAAAGFDLTWTLDA